MLWKDAITIVDIDNHNHFHNLDRNELHYKFDQQLDLDFHQDNYQDADLMDLIKTNIIHLFYLKIFTI